MQRLLIHNQDMDIFTFNFIYIKTSTSLPLINLVYSYTISGTCWYSVLQPFVWRFNWIATND